MPFWVILGHLVEFWLQKHHLHCIVKRNGRTEEFRSIGLGCIHRCIKVEPLEHNVKDIKQSDSIELIVHILDLTSLSRTQDLANQRASCASSAGRSGPCLLFHFAPEAIRAKRNLLKKELKVACDSGVEDPTRKQFNPGKIHR